MSAAAHERADLDFGRGLEPAAAAVAGRYRQAERDQERVALAELLVDEPPPGSDTWFHADLAGRAAADLLRERALLRLALLLHPDPPAWWMERLAALNGAVRRR